MLDTVGALGRAALERSLNLLGMLGLFYSALKSFFLERGRGRRLFVANTASQVYFTSVQPIPFFLLAALIFGLVMIVEFDRVLGEWRLDYYAPNLIVTGLLREVAPLVVAMIVIGRSGPAIATELGSMTLNKEVDALALAGINIDYFVVLPRILGVTLATAFVLVFFGTVALGGGFLFGKTLNLVSGTLLWSSLVDAITVSTILCGLLKALIFGATIAVANCFHGLNVGESFTEIPQANARGAQSSLVLCFLANALVSLYAVI